MRVDGMGRSRRGSRVRVRGVVLQGEYGGINSARGISVSASGLELVMDWTLGWAWVFASERRGDVRWSWGLPRLFIDPWLPGQHLQVRDTRRPKRD